MNKGSSVLGVEGDIKKLAEQLEFKADRSSLEELRKLLNEVRKDIEEIKTDTSNNTESIEELKKNLNLLDTKLAELAKELNKIKNSQKGVGVAQQTGPTVDPSDFNKLVIMVETLRSEMDGVLKELKELRGLKNLHKMIKDLEAALEGKLDREEFEKWKAENDLNSLLNGLLKKFAERNEMMKALKKLESRIAILEEMMHEQGIHDIGEHALLAKKPLGGWSCASCQKDLINIEGMKVQYYPWAKLPQRNPADRIAKVGQGFSRMLSAVKPEMIAKSHRFESTKKEGEEEPGAIINEEPKSMAKSHAQGFYFSPEMQRPNSMHVLPKIQQKVI